MRSTDLEFCYTVETAPLFGLRNRHAQHTPRCGCPSELVEAAAVLRAGRAGHYADPDRVGPRAVRRLRSGWTPWWLRRPGGAWVTVAWAVAAVVAAWVVYRGGSVSAAAATLFGVRMLAAAGRGVVEAATTKMSPVGTSTTVLAPMMIQAPDLAATLAVYARLVDDRAASIRSRLGAAHAHEFDTEASRLLYAAAAAARDAGTYARLATLTGAVASRPLGDYFDVSGDPPRPRLELVCAPDGRYLDPNLDRVAGGLRACVGHLDALASLLGWHPVRGPLRAAEVAGRPVPPPDTRH